MLVNKSSNLSSKQKLIMGLVFIPAYLLQESIYIRTFQLIILISVYIYKGGKFRILPNLMLFSGILLAYILIPTGKVIIMLGNFPLTRGSVNSGLTRALMIIGLIYISRLSVSSKLNFKGNLGNLIGRVFFYFEAITEWKGEFPIRDFYRKGYFIRVINFIDNLLISVDSKEYRDEVKKVDIKNYSSIFIVIPIILFISISYLLLLPPLRYILLCTL